MVNDPPHLIFVPVGIVFARDHQVSLTFSDGDPLENPWEACWIYQ